MNPSQVLHQIKTAGLQFRAGNGGRLIVFPAKKITPRLRQLIKSSKPDLLSLLAQKPETVCPECSGGHYWQPKEGGPWHCSSCNPVDLTDQTTLTLPSSKQPMRSNKPILPVREILERAASQAEDTTPRQLFAALSPADLRDIQRGLIGVEALAAMARSLLVTGCLPVEGVTNEKVLPKTKVVRCGECQYFEPNPEGCGGVGRCRLNLGNDRSKPSGRHPAGQPLGLALYPGTERQCAGFKRILANSKDIQ